MKNRKRKTSNHRVLRRRLQIAAASVILACLAATCLAGLVAVDYNTRKTGLSHAPGLMDIQEVAPKEYRLDLLDGRYSLVVKIPWR